MLSGYGLASWVNRDYRALPSPRTVYLKLYSLERKGLTEGVHVLPSMFTLKKLTL